MEEILTNPETTDLFYWSVLDPTTNDQNEAQHLVSIGDGWGAIVIPPTFSELLFAGAPVINGSLVLNSTVIKTGLGTLLNTFFTVKIKTQHTTTQTHAQTLFRGLHTCSEPGDIYL